MNQPTEIFSMKKYQHSKIESKWQKIWQAKKFFAAKDFSKKPKKYVLVEFPYPSGEGLHMGHLRPYVAADVYTRYFRMRGNEVIFPMGWDAFGLPAENYAIKQGVHPSIATKKNISNAKRQMQSWGLSFDWSREVNTTDPNYYKWTQWIFLQFYKAGLAYEATGLINWCPKDKTGLANEEVIDGKCERCGSTVEKKELRQWYLKITAYAEKLLEGLKHLPKWPEPVKLQQENWIGKSVGAEIDFILDQPKVKRFVILHARGGYPDGYFYPWLKRELESRGYEVQAPAMPDPEAPNDDEQAEFVSKNFVLDESTVLLGHSFGNVVALRLLERGHKVNRVILVGAPFYGKFLDNKTRPTVTAAVQKGFDFKTIKKNSNSFTLLYDTHDYVISVADGEAFSKALGFPLIKLRAQKPHFMEKVEPDVLSVALGATKVFTTRVDTLPGATFIVIAPEHALIESYKSQIINYKEVAKYVKEAKDKTDIQRTAKEKEKTGVELKGIKAINPVNDQRLPIWVADYALMGFGTGALFGDAHDERDQAFAKKYNIPLKVTLKPADGSDDSKVRSFEEVFTGDGILYNSGEFDGLGSEEARKVITKWLVDKNAGKATVTYKLRDWVFSRQRYWGEPIPIIHCSDCGIVPVPEKDLPVKLPKVKNYQPTGTGESPLAGIDKWVNVKCPNCGGEAKRETNTMPQWAGSSWYWLRYTDPNNKKGFASISKQKYWTPVDVYFGGMEHTTLHLLYSRFWNLFLYDQKLVTAREPYTMRKPHGIILGTDGEKMSKSRGNVVNPDSIVKSYGADTLRMYELFLGPHEATVSWNEYGHIGVRRFLDRVWGWGNEVESKKLKVESESENVQRALHRLTKKITEDIENFRFNTSVSAFMEFHNEVKDEPVSVLSLKIFLTVLYPFAPHVAEELNSIIGNKTSLQLEPWPKFNPEMIVEDTVEIVVQINGKVKGKINLPTGSSQLVAQSQILKLDSVKQTLSDQSIKRIVFVKDKLINLVI